MRDPRGLGASVVALAAACHGAGRSASPADAGTAGDGAAADSAVVESGGGSDASSEALADASEATVDAQVPSCLGAAREDAGTICSTAACVARSWAQWPMPNSAAEVAQGAPNPASYAAHGDGTVTDVVTGLMWQVAPPASASVWADATAYCAGLTLAGHTDWRLPAYVELVSIVDYSQSAPAIDPTAFPSTLPVDVWTGTPFAQDPTSAWEIYFSAGDSSQDPLTGTNNVRCVRGPDGGPATAVPPARYSIAAGEVHDTQTGLTWQADVGASTFAWTDAKTHCTGLASDGGGPWRLPTTKELLTLVDVTRAAPPAVDCEAFPAATRSALWSATQVAGNASNGWAVDFRAGYPLSVDTSTALGVRCVR